MTKPIEDLITELLLASHDDQETLLLPVNDRTFGFHTQQAIEKLLKALIAAHAMRFDYIHDLETLLEQVADLGEKVPVPVALAGKLTMFAGKWRYQKPGPFAADERAELIKTVETLRAAVLARVTTLRPNISWPAA